MSNPNLPADYFLPGVKGSLYQVVAPDGRVVANFLPHDVAMSVLHVLQHGIGGTQFVFQAVPADQLGSML